MSFQPQLLIERWDGGANTHDIPESIGDNQSWNPRGVDFFGKTVGKVAGYSLLGSADAETVPGFTLFNHRVLSEEEVMVKNVNTSLKFYDEVTDSWQLLTDATFTAGRRWWFASFNGYLYGGNGVDNFVRWKASAWSTLTTAVTAASTTMVLETGTGARYAATGDGMVEGDTFSWTGVSTDTLTGVTGLTSSHAIGARVITKLDSSTYSGLPKGSIGLFFKNRIYTRDDATPNFWYFSKLADNTNPQDDLANFTIAAAGAGDAGFIIFPARTIGVVTFITGANDAVQVVFCADGNSYSVTVTDTGGTTVGLIVPFKPLGQDLAGPQTLGSTENDIVVLDNLGQLRALGYPDTTTTLVTKRLGDDVENTTSSIDFSDGVVRYFSRKIFGIGKQNDAAQNNFTLVKDTNPNAFTFWDHWQFNDLVEWKNDLYGLSSINGNVYKLFDGLSAAGNSIAFSYPTKLFDFGAPLLDKEIEMARLSGVITTGGNLYIDLYYEGDENPSQTFLINGSNEDIVDPIGNVAIGTVVFGHGVFGGQLAAGSARREFYAELGKFSPKKFRRCYLVFRNDEADVDLRLHKLLLYAKSPSKTSIENARVIAQQ